MDLISYFAVQHQIVIHHGECWTLSGFSCYLACFYALIEHKKGSKFVSHFIADFKCDVPRTRAKHSYSNLCILPCTASMDICHICVICCAVQLLSSNVALIVMKHVFISVLTFIVSLN